MSTIQKRSLISNINQDLKIPLFHVSQNTIGQKHASIRKRKENRRSQHMQQIQVGVEHLLVGQIRPVNGQNRSRHEVQNRSRDRKYRRRPEGQSFAYRSREQQDEYDEHVSREGGVRYAHVVELALTQADFLKGVESKAQTCYADNLEQVWLKIVGFCSL